MGVPKFFRYTSERYPCLNELVKQYQIPEFDNMYLDMNGIIHNCSHPDDSNPHFRITEEKIFKDIFHYISVLFQIIKPKKLFFMAIDGVAPRAKMNQQRGRRFRSAKEAEKQEEAAREKGEALPAEKRFDSNCITPGTVFMARLHKQLKYFIKDKMSSDPLWSKVKVILSGHETPGEGEHKIMDYIRWARSQPDYCPSTRHCLYGLDADLIMLGVCTHEPHFALLREEVKFGRSAQRATSPEDTNFYLLHLSLLREYLEQEFLPIKDKLPFQYDIENIIDDWVLMGFLMGNDFTPNLPNMHISNDALPLLYKTYMAVLPTLGGYINEAGDLNLKRFEVFMLELAKIDKEKFQETYADLKYFEDKTGRRPNAHERTDYKPNNDDTFNVNLDDIKANKPDDELQALIDATQDLLDDAPGAVNYADTGERKANMELEFILHKRDYYMNKLDYSNVTDEVLSDQAECYVRAIQWNLWYYYRGCPSWCWFYPHHYAPYISDIKDFADMSMDFELGEPFKPFEQLLAVLPSASRHLLPTPFHDLMTDPDSPILRYYPAVFQTDLNGKKNDWEAVVLLPFIAETDLLSAMVPCYQRLTEEELERNSHGPMLIYNWTPDNLGPIIAPEYFPSMKSNHAIEEAVWRHELDVPLHKLKRGLLPNADKDVLFPGFPTMRHLKYRTSIKKCKVKVFDQPSRNDSMMLEIIPSEAVPELEELAAEVLGKVIWVGWPHLTKAKVITISNEKMRLHHTPDSDGLYTIELNTGNLHQQWISERSTVIEHNMNRLGIELGEVKVLIHAVNLRGYKYIIQDNCRMVVEEQWCSVSCGYAHQATVPAALAPAARSPYRTPAEAYPRGDRVFLLTTGNYYGCIATVMSSEAVRNGRIKVSVCESSEPIVRSNSSASPYKPPHHAAAECGLSNQVFSRITGTVLVIPGERNDLPTETQNKINVGLNLKFNKKNQEVSGYSRRNGGVAGGGGNWVYSNRCVRSVAAYCSRFPEVFAALANAHRDVFFESDLWPNELGNKKVQEIAAWLKTQPHNEAPRRECGSEALEPEEMRALYHLIERQLGELKAKEKNVTLHVKWSLLYKPELHEGNVQPDTNADFKIFDRVVCVSNTITVPLGAKGTVTGVYQPSDGNTVRLSDKLNAAPSYQVMFDEPFPGAMKEELFDDARFYRMQPAHILNISFGRKLRNLNEPLPFEYNYAMQQTSALSNAQPPTLLRRDGLHSAFASYSPPRELKTPVAENKSHVNNNIRSTVNGQTPDNATNLLKSLLKISESEIDGSKTKHLPDPNTNWRSRNENPPSSPQKTTQSNWRKETNLYSQAEWTNNTQKPLPIGMPSIPFPSFGPPHHRQQGNPPQPYQPQPYQPQPYPPQPYQPHEPNPPHPFNALRQPPGQSFPKHLPDVSRGINLMPSWTRGENLKSVGVQSQQANRPNNNGEKFVNPFVPLQVQTSQRRVQPPGGFQRRDLEGLPAPRVMHPAQDTAVLNVQPQQQTRPQRKKKTRIAANLPFQMD